MPCTSIRPVVGVSTPARVRTRVDLPAPLAPMMPSAVPTGTCSEMSVSACTSATARSPRPSRRMAVRRVGFFSKVVRYTTETFLTSTAVGSADDGGGGGPVALRRGGGVGGGLVRGGQRTHAPGR